MASAMTLGDSDAAFPGQHSDAIPPSPSRENPGQVYPKSDPTAAPPDSVPGSAKSAQDRVLEEKAIAQKEAGKADAASAETGGMFKD
ncbi:hypothetical protein EWM64_g7850 [Hericium alpestre]|uniref:Uncharacterized protein n=1 Tax=Hericium alpestre TaxID=135208 RepID=A0A4Y9ZQQ1_9AGAM|nr:hypothetical protein EWM64_g7850 [Hericium alpestre]